MQHNRQRFAEQGLNIAAISYDSPQVLRDFAARKGITYPLLSDAGSRTIRALGILNETIPAGTPFFGIPYPGTFIVSAAGIVEAKYFEDDFRERYTSGDILVRRFGAQAGESRSQVETRHLKLEASASTAEVHWGQRIALVLDIDLKLGMHVYAPGVTGGYIPIDWKIDASPNWTAHDLQAPPSRQLHLDAIDETVPVYEGRFRLVRDVTVGKTTGDVVIRGSLRYQACDDKVCYNPQVLPLEWKLRATESDTQRVPEPLRRKESGR